jgi:hypothetical protein
MKAALGFAVSVYGLQCFDATDARRIILKQEPDVHRWVGGTFKEMAEVVPQPGHIHLIAIYTQEIGGLPYLMAQISLFYTFALQFHGSCRQADTGRCRARKGSQSSAALRSLRVFSDVQL